MSRRPDVYFSISKKNPLPDHVTADQAEQLVAFERNRRDRLLLGGVGGGGVRTYHFTPAQGQGLV